MDPVYPEWIYFIEHAHLHLFRNSSFSSGIIATHVTVKGLIYEIEVNKGILLQAGNSLSNLTSRKDSFKAPT